MIRHRSAVSPPENLEAMTSEHRGVKLIEHAKNGNTMAVRQQLLDGCDVNYRCPPDGATALYWAACNGHLTTCDWLVRYGADVNQTVDKSGSLPLHGAADRGHVDCVLLLIGRGSQVDARTKSNNDTALHLAAYRGHLDVCRVLLGHGACAEVLNAQGCTALDEARTQNHYEIYQLLWKHRQRHQNYSVRDRPAITTRCSNLSSAAPIQPKRNKLITEVITSSVPADNLFDVTSYKNVSGERIFEITESSSRPQSTKVIEIHSPPIFWEDGKDSEKSDISTPPSECPSPENSRPVWNAVLTPLQSHEEEDFDSTVDLVRRLDDLLAYSGDLQIQLALRQDENDHLTRENRDLSERLEIFRRLSQTIEDVNRAKAECERRALRAESELALVKQRYETLEMSNRTLENRLRLAPKDNDDRCCCGEISSRNHRRFIKLGTDELQPRG